MIGTISRDEWFVPRLHSEDPFTETMQMGQLRVLGVVKSWAPPAPAARVPHGPHAESSRAPMPASTATVTASPVSPSGTDR